jgi:hypothetical protein
MPVQDQVVWQNVNVTVAGRNRNFARGELLPNPTSEPEANNRALLRLGGALRVVEVVYTEAELAQRRRSTARPAAAAARAGITAAEPAPAAPAAAQAATPEKPAEPPGSGPVVLGPKPVPSATKHEWKDYAVSQGMEPADADDMTRDQLAAKYRDAD